MSLIKRILWYFKPLKTTVQIYQLQPPLENLQVSE